MIQLFDFYEDPGHGWVKVPKNLLGELGIADKITPFSYERGQYAYLEEDCDMTTFIQALQQRNIKPEFRTHISRNRDSRIRSYAHYNAGAVAYHLASRGF